MPIFPQKLRAAATTAIIFWLTGFTGFAKANALAAGPHASSAGRTVLSTTGSLTIAATDNVLDASLSPDTIPFVVGDGSTAASSVTVTATSTNPAVVPAANLVLGGSGANRTLTVTPAEFGQTFINLDLTDGTGAEVTAAIDFQADLAPTISSIPSQTVKGTVLGPLAFTVQDSAWTNANLKISATSSDPTVVSNLGIAGPTNGDQYSLTGLVLKAGPCVVTVTVLDPDNVTASTAFAVDGGMPQANISVDNTQAELVEQSGQVLSNADFQVTLSPGQTAPVTVNYGTQDGAAKAGTDYVAESGTLTFAPGGSTTQIVSIPVIPGAPENSGTTFSLVLSDPSTGVTLQIASGTATIYRLDPTLVGLSPSALSTHAGTPSTVTATYGDGGGYRLLNFVQISVGATGQISDSFYAQYLPQSNLLSVSDTTGRLIASFSPGSNNVITGPFGSLDCSKTTVSGSGNNLTIGWSITPGLSLIGKSSGIYLQGSDTAGSQTNLSQLGSWTVGPPVPYTVSLSPTSQISNAGVPGALTATYADTTGFSSLTNLQLCVGSNGSPATSLYAQYLPSTNQLFLFQGDNLTVGGFAPGSNNVITTPLGSLDCSKCSFSRSGDDLTMVWNVTPSPALVGPQQVYLQAGDAYSASTWAKFGTWNVTPPQPFVTSLIPTSLSSAAGFPQPLITTYGDQGGYGLLTKVQVCVGSNGYPSTSLYAEYLPSANLLYLFNANNVPVGGFAPGSNNVITTPLGSLDCSQTSVTGSGNNLTVVWYIAPAPAFQGIHSVYLQAVTANSATSWMKFGTWTVGRPVAFALGVSPTSQNTSANTPSSLTATYADGAGYASLTTVQICVGSNGYPATTFYAEYLPGTNLLYVFNASNVAVGGFAPGSANVISTPLGSLDCSKTTVTGSGNYLVVNWSITPSTALEGAQGVYIQAQDANSGTDWAKYASWTIAPPKPSTVSLSPVLLNTEAGTPSALTAIYADGGGYAALTKVQVCVGTNGLPATSLYAEYLPGTNQLYLFDANNVAVGGFAPGSANVITTTLGSLDCSKTTVTGNGDDLTVVWNITPTTALGGTQYTYLQAADASASTNWGFEGNWTISSVTASSAGGVEAKAPSAHKS